MFSLWIGCIFIDYRTAFILVLLVHTPSSNSIFPRQVIPVYIFCIIQLLQHFGLKISSSIKRVVLGKDLRRILLISLFDWWSPSNISKTSWLCWHHINWIVITTWTLDTQNLFLFKNRWWVITPYHWRNQFNSITILSTQKILWLIAFQLMMNSIDEIFLFFLLTKNWCNQFLRRIILLFKNLFGNSPFERIIFKSFLFFCLLFDLNYVSCW